MVEQTPYYSPENVTPRLGPIEPVVMKHTFDLPFDTDSTQTACGQTVRSVNGSKDWRVTFTGVLTLEQARRLDELRRQQTSISVRTALFGETTVDFDTLSLKRTSEEAVGEIEGVTGPIYEFQVQSKQDSGNSDQTFGESTVNGIN